MKKMIHTVGLILAGLMVLAHSIVPHHHHDNVTSCCEHEHHEQHEHDALADAFIPGFLAEQVSSDHADCSEHEHEHHCNLSFESLVKQVQLLAVFNYLTDFKLYVPQVRVLYVVSDYLSSYHSQYLSTSPTRGSPLA